MVDVTPAGRTSVKSRGHEKGRRERDKPYFEGRQPPVRERERERERESFVLYVSFCMPFIICIHVFIHWQGYYTASF